MKPTTEQIEVKMWDTLYHYKDTRTTIGTQINLYKYVIVRITPNGYWIVPDFYKDRYIHYNEEEIKVVRKRYDTARFILGRARKKYAHPTKEAALESFIARKRRQISILEGQLEQANNALRKACIIRGVCDETND